MARTRATAVSALILAVGLTGAAVSPFIMQAASASAVVAEPPPVEGCDAGEVCDPEVTVTVTTTEEPPEPDPETTITKTVTKSPTSKPKPTPSKTPKNTPTPKTSSPSTQQQQPPVMPSQSIEVPSSTPESTPESSVQLPTVAGTLPPSSTPPPSPTEEPTEESQALELRNAAPEFDQRTLTQKLSIPALVLVLLALFAVLIFEGRLRRMAHAAAVRKAGPRPQDPHGYPAGPGYTPYPGYPAGGAQTSYPGGTAYAPIISFVPVQTYPGGQPAYPEPAVYQDPTVYGHQGYDPGPPSAPSEPVVLHPDEFDSYSHDPAPAGADDTDDGDNVRGAFEPLIPPDPPPTDIPSGGSGPYDATREMPLAPGSSAEPGDEDLFRN